MDRASIRHEATQQWCFCIAPGKFIIRLQTKKDDMRAVTLHSRDKYLPLKLKDTRKTTPMVKVACDGLRDYYEAELEFHMVCLRYCFELEGNDGSRIFFSNCGFTAAIPEDHERHFDCPQTLREEERFQVPTWAANQVIYQIFPSRFATDLPVKDRVWYQTPVSNKSTLGGNLRGIIQQLEYIRDLGADVIYMTPIFRSDSCHKYDTIDYYTIDPSFGTEADLIELVDKAHALGMRVILDAVFNHTSPDFFAFQDLCKHQENSAYRDWYYVDKFPLCRIPGLHNYKCFGYFWHMPKVNLRCPEAAAYFTDVALHWLRVAGIDGWRLDVADEVSHDFWRSFRKAVKAEFPAALIIGEIWHHAPDFMQGDQWDTLMNYPFYRSVIDFVAEGTIGPSEFMGNLGYLRGNTHNCAYPLLWNLIGSHDTPRIFHLCGGDRQKHRLAAALQLLLPGMPMVYYGDEVAMDGGPDPDNRRGMLWDEARQDRDMLRYYRRLLQLRREVPALTHGQLTHQHADDSLGLIRMDRQLEGKTVTLLFHAGQGSICLPELQGLRDAITDTEFDGKIHGYQALVLS